MVKLRIRELAQEKVYRLLSLSSGVSEEAIRTYAMQTTEDIQKIATALNCSVNKSGTAKAFQMLKPDKAKETALNLLSKSSKISEVEIEKYANENEDFNITEKIEDLKKIAEVLDVNILELIKPKEKREAVKLKILNLAREKGLSLKDLANQSKIEFPIICFYSSQPLEKVKLQHEPFHTNLEKISKVLDCSIEDLQDTLKVDLPPTVLRVQEFLDATDLTINNLSMLTDTTPEFIDLIANNPIDMRNIPDWGEEKVVCEAICIFLHCNC
ncbi:helix-turn-helix domain-containing protein [Halotia branconii]|uniref:Helix-turn-helix transcriptional regulator n=1 Tax=Halotia branconii CENA392 TaxID=1539056 RepID=A0AAJ6P8B5_9CYAN|nr:helix-turn-helix transcriptional regulator [Halotia branconii]WGV24506.1 helix-turn-helix transcriptional regulator [Halotia branconii CENA392]